MQGDRVDGELHVQCEREEDSGSQARGNDTTSKSGFC